MQVQAISRRNSIETRSWGALFLVSLMIVLNPSPAQASSTYEVPEGGLSFDARDTTEVNPCTAGYGNLEDGAEIDEVNFLKATDSLRYENVAVIGGQAIDADVTLTSVTGMEEKELGSGDEATLARLDKCADTDDQGLLEVVFDSETALPGDANFVITIDFLLSGGNTAATLTNLKMNVEDIDHNQYLEVDNFSSTRLAPGRDSTDVQEYRNGDVITVQTSPSTQTSTLTTAPSARRYHSTGSSSSSDPTAEKDKHVVEVTYASVSTLVLTLGVYESGGGSFDLNFRGFEFESDTQQPLSGGESSSVSGPAIALTPLFRLGEQACSRDVLTSGFGLKSGSQQTLTLWQPKTQLSQTTLTGTGFEQSTRMPDVLSAGTYQLTLSATGQNDQPLDLVRTFTVDSACVVTALDEGKAGSVSSAGLARTGAETPYSLIALTLALLAAGVAAVGTSRRIERSSTR